MRIFKITIKPFSTFSLAKKKKKWISNAALFLINLSERLTLFTKRN